MDPCAIMNTQEIWAQPSPPPSSTNVTCVTMPVTRVDSRATAGSNTQSSPSPPLLLPPPSPPSTNGRLANLTATLALPNATITTTKSGRNEEKRLLGVSDKTDQAEDVDARIELTWQTYGVYKPHRRHQMVDAALEIIQKYNENEGRGNEVGDHNYADTLVAVINTLAAKYQKCVQAKQPRIPSRPNATVTPMATRRVDTCVTAQLSPSLPPLSASPASPSMDEHLARPMAISMQSNTTLTAPKSGRNEEKDEGKRPLGVSKDLEELGSKTPRIADGKWFKYHSPNLPTPQTTPLPLLVPKPTRFAPPGGNCHPQLHQPYTPPPSTFMTRFNASLRAEDTPRQPPQQLAYPSSTNSSKTTRFALLGGNHHPTPCFLTTPELESSICTCDECHTAQEQMDDPSGLDSSPPESTKRAPTPSRFRPMFLMEREGKWIVAGAQHHPLCFEGETESENNANRIEKGRKGASRAIAHSLSGLTPQTHTLPPSTCFDVYSRAEISPGLSQTPSDSKRMVERGCKPMPTHIMRSDANLRVENFAGTSQTTSPLPTTKMTRFVSVGGNHHHHVLSSLTSTQQDTHLRVLDITQALPAMPRRVSTCDSSMPPPTTYTTRFDVSLRVENCSGSPQSLPDTTRATKRGNKPTQPSSLSPSHIPRTDKSPHVVDVCHTTSSPLGQNPTCPARLTPPTLCITQVALSSTTSDPLGQIVRYPTPPFHSPLASQDAQTKPSLSIITGSILDTQALLGNVSLINEINSVFLHPSWVKCGDVITSPILGACMLSSNVYVGVKDSHSPHQDFYQDPEEYMFDPDPGTRKNDFCLRSLRAICPLFHIIRWTFNLPRLLVALTGYQ